MKRITQDTPAALVRECREAAGHDTICGAVRATNEPYSTIRNIEAGVSDPSVSILARVLAKLGWRLKLVAERTKP